jgi:hypothetical protein
MYSSFIKLFMVMISNKAFVMKLIIKICDFKAGKAITHKMFNGVESLIIV